MLVQSFTWLLLKSNCWTSVCSHVNQIKPLRSRGVEETILERGRQWGQRVGSGRCSPSCEFLYSPECLLSADKMSFSSRLFLTYAVLVLYFTAITLKCHKALKKMWWPLLCLAFPRSDPWFLSSEPQKTCGSLTWLFWMECFHIPHFSRAPISDDLRGTRDSWH